MIETRTLDQIRQHYEVEIELSNRLRHSSKEQRRTLYSEVYNELFHRVPLHPQITNKSSPERTAKELEERMKIMAPFLTPQTVLLEVGPGDCAFSKAAARKVARVVAVDVSDEITRGIALPANVQIVISDGSTVPVEPGSANVAYSDQLMEHLHPDDALEQLHNIFTALAPGGLYVCITPSRLTGPHDVSAHFDDEAKGFHLKEYTISDLAALFRQVGFGKLRIAFGGRGKFIQLPVWPSIMCEKLVSLLPKGLRKFAANKPPFRWLFAIRLIGWKP